MNCFSYPNFINFEHRDYLSVGLQESLNFVRVGFEKRLFDFSLKLISNQIGSIRNYIESNSNYGKFVRMVFANYYSSNLEYL
jgi:hypothetical protein